MKNKVWLAFVYFFVLMLITTVIEVAYHKGYTFYRIESYAIDSTGCVFIGKIGKIDIYDGNDLVDTIQLPVQHSYIIEILPNKLIRLLKNDDIYYLDMQGNVIRKEKNSNNINISLIDVDIYEDTNGNYYKYSDSILGRKKIIKDGKEIVFIETRWNQIATVLKQWQFIEFLLALCLFAGKGHPVMFVKIAAKRISEGKIVYLSKFDDYCREYHKNK